MGGFANVDPDADEELTVYFVQTPSLHVSLVHMPLVQETDVEEFDECATLCVLGCTMDKPECETVLNTSDSDFDWPGLTDVPGLLVQIPFLHVSLVHLPLTQEIDFEECEECAIF